MLAKNPNQDQIYNGTKVYNGTYSLVSYYLRSNIRDSKICYFNKIASKS